MPPRFVLPLVAMIGLLGCGSSMQVSSTGPELNDAAAPREGLRYYLGRDLLVVDANVTIRTERQWKKKEKNEPCQPEDEAKSSWRQATWDVSSTTVADRRAQYRLGLKPSTTVLQTLNVTVSEAGLLTGVNYTSKDQTGEIVINLAKGVAGLAGALVGIPSALDGADFILPSKGKPVVKPPTNEVCYAADADGIKLREEAQRLRDTLAKALDTRRKRLAEADRATTQAALELVRTVTACSQFESNCWRRGSMRYAPHCLRAQEPWEGSTKSASPTPPLRCVQSWISVKCRTLFPDSPSNRPETN
jgi:hypothetical protein